MSKCQCCISGGINISLRLVKQSVTRLVLLGNIEHWATKSLVVFRFYLEIGWTSVFKALDINVETTVVFIHASPITLVGTGHMSRLNSHCLPILYFTLFIICCFVSDTRGRSGWTVWSIARVSYLYHIYTGYNCLSNTW